MTAIEESLLQTLVKLDETVKSMANAGSKPDLLPIFSRLDQLARQLPPGTAPDLLHYLHKKSYEKARLWLENRNVEIQRGSCHPKT